MMDARVKPAHDDPESIYDFEHRRDPDQGRLASIRRGGRRPLRAGATRHHARRRARRAPLPDRTERLRQVDLAQRRRRADDAHRRLGGSRGQAGRQADAARHRLRVPGERAVPVEHRVRERQPRHGVPGRAAGRARGARATLARGGRAQGLRAALSSAALRRHAPACRARARAQSRNRHPAHGRAVRGARRADPHDPRRGPLGTARARRQDHRVRDPQPGRSHLSRRPRRGVFRPPRHHQGDHQGRRAAPAQARFRDLGQVHRHPQRALRPAARRDPQDHGRELGGTDAMRRSGNEREGRLASRAVQVTFLIALVALWYLATTRWRVSPLLLPNPVAVLRDFWDILKTGEFIGDLRVTLTELAAAFAIAASCGVVVGYLISRSQYRIRVFEPLFAGIYSVPIILFLPLYVLFFGLGPASKIALGATIGFFPIALNTVAGFGYVDRVLVVAARSMGASDLQLFRYVLLPAALPIIQTGMRMGFTVALLSIIGSETIASLAGLGHRIVHLAEGMEMAPMFAYIAFVVAIAAILNALVSLLEARGRRP